MKKISFISLSVLVLLIAIGFLHENHARTKEEAASGRIINGFRVLPVSENNQNIQLTVYRGDYIRFSYVGANAQPVLSIPALSISETLSSESEKAPFFKMKKTGSFAFSLGNAGGTITVVEYRKANYETVSAVQAAELIRNISPVILDVRTPLEYREGHLENAALIPIQELQGRVNELMKYKDENILIYCATGNRSTVASKILLDNDFKRIFNMRYGIYEWKGKNMPIVLKKNRN